MSPLAIKGRNRQIATYAILVGISILAFLRYLSISHGRTFHFDEWYWVLLRNDFSRSSLLENHNGHLSLIPGFIYVVLFRTIGLSRYSIYLSMAFVTHIAVCWVLFFTFARKFGGYVGLSIAALTLFMGSGAQNYLWAFQIGFMFSVLGYLLGRLAIVSDSKHRNVLLLGALVLSLGSSGIGIPTTAALGVEVLMRRWRLKNLWPFVASGSLYLAWYLAYGRSDADTDFAHLIPKYARDSAAAVIAGVFDFTLDWGYLALGLLCGVMMVTFIRHRKISPTAGGALAFLILFWSLTCLSRAQYWDVGAGRYVYAAFIPYLVLLWDLLPDNKRFGLNIGVSVLVPLAIWGSWSRMDSEAFFYKSWGQSVAAELRALELHRDSVPWDYFPDKVRAPNVYAESYFHAVDELQSSPAAPEGRLATLMKEARFEFDRVSLELGDVRVTIEPRGDTTCDGMMTNSERTRLRLHAGVQYLNAITGDVTIGFKRFGNFRSDIGQVTIPHGSTAKIDVRADRLTRDWVLVQLNPGNGLCRSLNQ